MTKPCCHFTPEQKVTRLRLHFLEKKPVSDICPEYKGEAIVSGRSPGRCGRPPRNPYWSAGRRLPAAIRKPIH
jgi:hypothetical protein